MISISTSLHSLSSFIKRKLSALVQWLQGGYLHFMEEGRIVHMVMLAILYTIAMGFIISPTINSTDPNMQGFQQYNITIWVIWISFTVYFAGYKRGMLRYKPEPKQYLSKKFWKKLQNDVNNLNDDEELVITKKGLKKSKGTNNT